MAKIRRGTLGGIVGVANFQWNDALEFDRRAADDEFSGDPVLMSKQGSGSFELLSGTIATGYHADMVLTYKEVSVTSSEESSTNVVVTFKGVTINTGGNVDNDAGPGSRSVSFDYEEVA